MVSFDWAILEKVGIGGALVAVIFFGYKIVMFLLEQWKNSTDALNRNSDVFEKAHQRELEFQKEALRIMKDTNSKVTDIHRDLRK